MNTGKEGHIFSLKELREKLGCVNLMYGAKTSCGMLWKVLAKIHVIEDFEVLHNLNSIKITSLYGNWMNMFDLIKNHSN